MEGAITDVEGIRVGHAEDAEARTGCTVILAPPAAMGGIATCGTAPANRELDLLRIDGITREIHAVLLTGGSAFGSTRPAECSPGWRRTASASTPESLGCHSSQRSRSSTSPAAIPTCGPTRRWRGAPARRRQTASTPARWVRAAAPPSARYSAWTTAPSRPWAHPRRLSGTTWSAR